MGAHASGGQALSELSEPLLRAQCQQPSVAGRSRGASTAVHPATPGSGGSLPSAPASFKACKHRKTKDFIGSEISLRRDVSRTHLEVPTDVDPRLVDEADTTHAISAKVASLIFQYIEEGGPSVKGPGEDDFHEANFLRRRCCCCPRRSAANCLSVEVVFGLINDIADSLYFCKQVIVLCAVYVDRLLAQTRTTLTISNWRSVVIVALLTASKVWEDVHPWNADFEECLQEVAGIQYRQGALYRLESIFLEKLEWRVFVDGEIYAAYFFSLLEQRGDGKTWQSSSGRLGRSSRERQRHYSDFAIQTIMEDEPHAGSDSDIERGILSSEDHSEQRWSERSRCGASALSSTFESPIVSPAPCSPLPWSRDQLVCRLRQHTLDTLPSGDQSLDSSSLTLKAIHECWRLDAGNPYIGSLRHAPRALAPSRHIPQSEELLWAHELAAKTANLLGHRKPLREDAAHTLSGATGTQLASEIRQYLAKRSEESSASKHEREAGANLENEPRTLSVLEEEIEKEGTWSRELSTQ